MTRKISKEAREKARRKNYEAWLSKAHHVHGKKFDYVAAEKTFTKQQGEPVEILCKAHKAAFFVKPEKHLRYEYGGCAACRNETGSFAKHEVEVFGQRFGSISELAANYEISASALSARLRGGQQPEDAVQALLPILVHGTPFKTLKAVAQYYNVPTPTLRHRIKKLGMTYEDAVALPVKQLKTGPVKVEGKTYKSFAAAAKAYGKDPEATRNRMKQGMSPEEAILTPNKRVKPVSYLGEDFASIAEFCDFYGISRATARSRLRANWALDDIINKPARYGVKVTYRGKEYSSISALCRELNVSYKLVYKRIHVFGWSVEEAVETSKIKGRSIHVGGNNFPTLAAAAKHYGIPPGLLQWRIATGWPLEKAVNPNAEVSNRKPIEVDGEFFDDLSSAARAYGLNPVTFMARVRKGWSNEQAAGLMEPPEFKKGSPPIEPNEYVARLYEIHGDNLDFSRAVFGKAQDKVEVKCLAGEEHSSFWATPNNLLRGKGCPICKISHGARKVARFLDNNDIPYEVEWTGHGLRSLEYERAVLRMDFHLLDRKTVIEYDGIQHFEPQTLGRMSEDQAERAFHQLQRNDARKNQWARENGYQMIRIKYDELVSAKLARELL